MRQDTDDLSDALDRIGGRRRHGKRSDRVVLEPNRNGVDVCSANELVV